MARLAGANKQEIVTTTPESQRTCLLVVGMHRSGTSALTRVLSFLGADLPRTLMQGTVANNTSNAPGHWESEPAARLSDMVLESAGTDWRSPEPVAASWYRSSRYAEMRDRAVVLLEEEFGSSPLFVFKDPRVCKLLPFWLDALDRFGAVPKVVSITRSPMEVAASLQKRNGFDHSISHVLWLRYVLDGEVGTREMPRFFTTYDGILRDVNSIIEGITSSFNITWPRLSLKTETEIRKFLSIEHRHHSLGTDMSPGSSHGINFMLREVYTTLTQWAEIGEQSNDRRRLDKIRNDLNNALNILGEPFLLAMHQGTQIRHFKAKEKHKDLLLRSAEEREEELSKTISSYEATEAQRAQRLSDVLDACALAEAQRDQAMADSVKLHDIETAHEAAKAELIEERRAFEVVNAKNAQRLSDVLNACVLAEMQRDQAMADNARLQGIEAAYEAVQIELIEERRSLHQTTVSLARIEERLSASEGARNELLLIRDNLAAQLKGRCEQLDFLRQEKEAAEIDRVRLETQLALKSEELSSIKDCASQLEAANVKVAASEEELILKQNIITDMKKSLLEVDALKFEIENIEKNALHYRKIAETRQLAIEHLRKDRARKISDRDKKNSKLESQIEILKEQLKRATREIQRDRRKESFYSRLGLYFNFPSSKNKEKRRRSLDALRGSDLFDGWWYLAKYEDVRLQGVDPAEHYLDFGGVEGRFPSRSFDGRWYLEHHTDVREAGLNPLLHYLEHGRLEGREIRNLAQTKGKVDHASANHVGYAKADTLKSAVIKKSGETAFIAPLKPVSKQWSARPLSFANLRHVARPESCLQHAGTITALDEVIAIDGVLIGKKASRVEIDHITYAACGWAPLFRWFGSARHPDIELPAPSLHSAMRFSLCEDGVQLVDAWFGKTNVLHFRFQIKTQDKIFNVKAYQFDFDGNFKLCAFGVAGPSDTAIFTVKLLSRYKPIIIVISGTDDVVLDGLILPFPSLLRGGDHAGEIAAQLHAEGFLSAVREASGKVVDGYFAAHPSQHSFALSHIEIASSGANGTEPVFKRELLAWLTRDLGVTVSLGESDDLENLEKCDAIPPSPTEVGRKANAVLHLPVHGIPTISALFALSGDSTVARAIHMRTKAELTGYSVVHDSSLARELSMVNNFPEILPRIIGAPKGFAEENRNVSIMWPNYSRSKEEIYFQNTRKCDSFDATHELTIIVDVKTVLEKAFFSSISSIRNQFDIELIIINGEKFKNNFKSFDCGCKYVTSTSNGVIERLLEASNFASASRLLFLGESVIFHDHRVATALWHACNVLGVGSASCALIAADNVGDKTLDCSKSIGWFAYSDTTGQQFLVKDDVAKYSLPQTISVAAADLRCLMIDKKILTAHATLGMSELEFGLSIIDAGMENLCICFVNASSDDNRFAKAEKISRSIPGKILNILEFPR